MTPCLTETHFQPTEINFYPTETNFQPAERKFHLTEANFQSAETKFQLTEGRFQPTETNFQPAEMTSCLTEAQFQLTERQFQPTEADFQLTEANFQLTEERFQPTETNFQPAEEQFQPREKLPLFTETPSTLNGNDIIFFVHLLRSIHRWRMPVFYELHITLIQHYHMNTLLQIDWTNTQMLIAFITGSVSILLAIWTYISGRMNQKRTLKNEREIEFLRNKSAEERSENDARRSYEFEARKRLYSEYEPLLFQLLESADVALHRIQSLARTAKNGDLNENGWLSHFEYYFKSTIYMVFAPVAIYQIMRKKLTLVDVTVDKSIGLRYKLAKQLYVSFTDDYEFAKLHRGIDYKADLNDSGKLRNDNPVKYWKQGLPMGLLDKTIELLIGKDKDGKEYLISYGEFDRKVTADWADKTVEPYSARDVFLLFHPKNRPVLWRLLVTQSVIYKALIQLKELELNDITSETLNSVLLKYTKEDIALFTWSNDAADENEIEEPFKVAMEYLKKRF